MIDDGPVFKLAIGREVKRFELDLAAWPRPPQPGGADWESYWRWRFEDMLFTVGIGIRKLIESGKVSLEIQYLQVELRKATLTSERVPDVLNLHRADEFYGVETAQAATILLLRLCHSIVHSYVLSPTFDYSGPSGLQLREFLLASDRDRRTHAYAIDWDRFATTVVHPVVTDAIIAARYLRTGRGDELRIPISTPELEAAGLRDLIEMYASTSKENSKAVKTFAKRYAEVLGYPHPDMPS